MLYTILIVLLVLALVGSFPAVGYAPAAWGYAPTSGLGVILILVVLALLLR